MADRDITGVAGFFDEFERRSAPPKSGPKSTTEHEEGEDKKNVETTIVRARTGRPPGVTSGSRSDKTKATMHINKALMDFYRDWSWEERCNLGALIERAMVAYKESRAEPANEKR